METVGSFEAKTHLASLLDRVAKGETITITRHGVPAALLVPVGTSQQKMSHIEIVEGMRDLRKRVKPGKMSVREMVDEGRQNDPRTGHLSLEIANAILVGERKKRLRQPEILRFTTLLESLSIVQDIQPVGENVNHVLTLAREYGLSAYDAAYLDLSIRHGASLATLDNRLEKAASRQV